ncbi:methylmalonyl-CoA mutase [Metabacillus crassostreae]|uniref:methylmalonyl-CoA mutase family protein n=1 Tax=Metabacillus crassostreae TaxID=929098 RepID=UPI001959FA15|nr:methylmalonyl-CoA mutase family protein [Metabacillus crassostreae]MBM7604565.1 methylmalonyl-CoA mutase [Metabacillus crassostreae]
MGDKQIVTNSGSLNEWKEEAERALRGKAFESLYTSTYEGIKLKPLYDSSDIENITKATKQRAISSKSGWKISQEIAGESQIDFTVKIQEAKKRGQNSFFINKFDFIKNSDDVTFALQEIDWENDSLFFDIGENIGFASLLFYHFQDQQTIKKFTGVIAFDPYEELVITGSQTIGLETKLDYLADIMRWKDESHFSTKAILIKGNVYHEAGANSVQELIYAFSHALEVINELLNRNISIDTIARNMIFSFAIGGNFFMEIAKLRAAKQIWASLISALGGNEESQKIYLHTKTAIYNKTKNDIYVNLLRTTTEGFAAAVAGVDEMTIDAFDSVFNNTSKLGERIARNMQFIFKEESFLAGVFDPTNGSYYVEALTNQLAEIAWSEIKKIDERGGFLETLKKGELQKDITSMHKQKINDVNTRKLHVIGTNVYANSNDHLDVSYEAELKNKQETNIQVYTFEEAMNYVEVEKKVPGIVSRNIDEIKIEPLKTQRLVEHFEKLRLNAINYKEQTGIIPKVQIVTVGTLKDYKPRLDFIIGLLTAGGIYSDVISYDKLNDLKSDSKIVIVCGTDKTYDAIQVEDLKKLKSDSNIEEIYLLGNNALDKVNKYGLSGTISSDINVYEFLLNIHNVMEVGI